MKYLIIMWVLCLFITSRHIYLHRPQPQTFPNASTPTVLYDLRPPLSITEGHSLTSSGASGSVGSSFTLVTAGSGGVATATSGVGVGRGGTYEHGTNLPATCKPGQVFRLDRNLSQAWYDCHKENVWTQRDYGVGTGGAMSMYSESHDAETVRRNTKAMRKEMKRKRR